jgi:hyperosmotically inducible protein
MQQHAAALASIEMKGAWEMKPTMNRIRLGLAALLLAAPALVQATTGSSSTPPPLEQKVRHELLMLPYYNVFDNLEYKVEGNTVTLAGQVVSPTLKNDALAAVRHIPGVATVINKIEVLPVSFMDNQIRRAELRAIYRQSALSRYALGAVPAIHIIVDNGHVTLEGVVSAQFDKIVAGIQANRVPNVFSVTNHLRVVKS